VTDDDDAKGSLEVEELTLDDLRGSGDGKDGDGKEPGGLRGGGLGPEGSRYRPPEAPRRATWKPTAIAAILIIAAGYGVFTIGYQLTLEDRAEGNVYTMWGQVLDFDAAYDQREVRIGGVNVTVDGVEDTAVTRSDGLFRIRDIPGGKFTIRFYKRSWDHAVNTEYTSILYTDVSESAAATFLVPVENLAPDRDRPVYEGTHGVLAEVMDWPSNDTVSLRLHATAFDEDLTKFTVQMGEPSELMFPMGNYANSFDYTFSQGGDQSTLTIRVMDESNVLYAQTILGIPEHPLGAGGWVNTDFPQVHTFVRGGSNTNGDDRTIAIHSNGATEYRYRVDGGQWMTWAPMADGHADLTWTPVGEPGDHDIEVSVRNETGVNGTSSTATITLIDTPPQLDPRSTRGPAVTNEATFDPGSANAMFIRYQPVIDGVETNWSAWQLYMDEVLVPVDDSGDKTNSTVMFQAMDLAGNIETANGHVTIKRLEVQLVDDHAGFYKNLLICLPIQGIGILLAIFGAMMAYKRKRPTMVMLGAMGALLAGYGIVGAIFAAAALVLVMMSREEFEMPGPAPERR
jgi:hypothetical protein